MSKVGRFKILYQLGAGGMAEVFLAHDAGVGGVERVAVVKRVLPHLIHKERFITMFLDEARIASRLNHPNIAHLYEVGRDEESYFLVMEFIHGADLKAVLRRQRTAVLAPELTALIGTRVAAALHHAYNLTNLEGQPLKVVHRDISPQNIRISHEGVVKVIDFGIAKAASNVENTSVGMLKGKLAYMSPEQVECKDLDDRSDVFSLGIVLFEMLTSTRLFKRDNEMETLRAVVYSKVPRPSEVSSHDVPPDLERIVMRALERDLDARYPSARAMQQDLEGYLRTHPATDTDLEQYMTRLFGSARENNARLQQALRDNTLEGILIEDSASNSAIDDRPIIPLDEAMKQVGAQPMEDAPETKTDRLQPALPEPSEQTLTEPSRLSNGATISLSIEPATSPLMSEPSISLSVEPATPPPTLVDPSQPGADTGRSNQADEPASADDTASTSVQVQGPIGVRTGRGTVALLLGGVVLAALSIVSLLWWSSDQRVEPAARVDPGDLGLMLSTAPDGAPVAKEVALSEARRADARPELSDGPRHLETRPGPPRVTVSVKTIPARARITLDQVRAGRRLSLIPGSTHTLQVSRRGCQRAKREFLVAQRDTEIVVRLRCGRPLSRRNPRHVKLVPRARGLVGYLRLESKSRVFVAIDGKPRGAWRSNMFSLSPGRHSVSLRSVDRKLKHNTKVNITARAITILQIDLKSTSR